MSVRLDPRRRDQLKRLAAEAELRPGELVTRWIIERLDREPATERHLPPAAGADPSVEALRERVATLEGMGERVATLEGLGERVATLEQRLTHLASSISASGASSGGPGDVDEGGGAPVSTSASSTEASESTRPRVGLHDEIAAVISERGPLPASEIAELVAARGRYRPPRSGRQIDATTVSARVSNPHYRHRFVRREGRIGLAEG